jgi:putative component of membrane protein insertase Oxa1/YidC/SpoIIIJ protein YidD
MKSFLFFIFFLLVAGQISAQSLENDLAMLIPKQLVTSHIKKGHDSKKNWNPLHLGYRAGITFYQKAISEQLATNCAFELTCSRFSKEMTKEYGLTKGYFLTFDRIARCNKISTLETFPTRINANGKIIETSNDFK